MADYEEQVLITGVKSNRHCPICTVPPNERENITKQWPLRTHEDTQAQINRQGTEKVPREDDSWVHPVQNFAWDQPLVNIHTSMTVDILHQLLKGIVMHLLQWTTDLLKGKKYQPLPKGGRKRKRLGVRHANTVVRLDHRFRRVPAFTDLHVFKHYSKVKQWTGKEQKSIVRVLLGVVTPLLQEAQAPYAIQCIRAVVDFTLLAMYYVHDDNTQRYMEQALYRLEKYMNIFRDFRPKDDDGEGHFNFAKIHALSHYTWSIRMYGTAKGVDTSYFERSHIHTMKEPYKRTNKREGFELYILYANTRYVNMIALRDSIMHLHTLAGSQADEDSQVHVNTVLAKADLTYWKWAINAREISLLRNGGLYSRYWRSAKQVQEETGVDELTDCLAVFVREMRKKQAGTASTDEDIDLREQDPAWVDDYLVAVHRTVKCWKRDGTNAMNLERQVGELIRCSPKWMCRDSWRRDFIWINEFEQGADHRRQTINGKLVSHLQLIFTVQDTQIKDPNTNKHTQYTGVIVDLLKPDKTGGPADPIHGMVEMRMWPRSTARNPRSLDRRRPFELGVLQRSAHMIPINEQDEDRWYLNPFIDWDQYNTVYDELFELHGRRAADEAFRLWRLGRPCH